MVQHGPPSMAKTSLRKLEQSFYEQTDARSNIFDEAGEDFFTRTLALYSGPVAKIQVLDSNHEYVVSRALLATHSEWFRELFSEFHQENQVLILDDEVITEKSFQHLLQWMYTGRVTFWSGPPEDKIQAMLNFVCLACYYGVYGMEELVSAYIWNTIQSNPAPINLNVRGFRDPDRNTYCLTKDHIYAAYNLPYEHPVRRLFAVASVEGYLLSPGGHKFSEQTQEVGEFAADLLIAVRETLPTMFQVQNQNTMEWYPSFTDPFTGERSTMYYH